MADIYDVIVYDEEDVYTRFAVRASAMGNAIAKAREKVRKRLSQIPKERPRQGVVMVLRRITDLHAGQIVQAFPNSKGA